MIKLENETGTHYIIQRHERFNIDQLVPGDVLIAAAQSAPGHEQRIYFILRHDAVFAVRRNGLSCPDWLLPKLVRTYKQQLENRLDALRQAKYRIGRQGQSRTLQRRLELSGYIKLSS